MILPGSYANGFAPRDGHPLYPELWRGCVGAWAPCLGPTGLTLRDWSVNKNHAAITGNTAATAWSATNGRHAILFSTATSVATTAARVQPQSGFAFSVWAKATSASTTNVLLAAYDASIGAYLQVFQTGNAYYFRIHQSAVTGTPYIGRLGGTTSTNLFHLAGKWTGGTTSASISLWLNGQRVDTANSESGTFTQPFGGSIPLLIGGQIFGGTVNAPWAGHILDVSAFSQPFSDNTIRTLSLRPGIMMELAPRRRSALVAGFNRRRRLLVGAGS